MNKEKPKSFKITQAIQNNQLRGLALAEKQKQQLNVVKFNSELTLDEVKQLYTKLNDAKDKYEPMKRVGSEGMLTKATLDFLANGGNSALAWCRLNLRNEGILKSYQEQITKEELNKEDIIPKIEMKIAKSMDEELMQVTYVAMKADFTDSQGDYTTADEVRKAKESFNRALLKKQTMSNLFHMFETNTFDVIESYLAPTDMSLNGHLVQKGDWLMSLQVNDKSLWEMIKNEEIVGLSIGAVAQVQDVNKE